MATKIIWLFDKANQFVTDRNWWQFHNPKNSALDIITEAAELSELFALPTHIADLRYSIADEMADVLFATLDLALITKIDLSVMISSTIDGNYTLNDHTCTYEDLQKLVLQNLNKFYLDHLHTPEKTIMSLLGCASHLTDLFVWCTIEESVTIAQSKQAYIQKYLALILMHLIILADLLKFNLPEEYIRKMAKNAIKYPVDKASGNSYEKIKDAVRNHKK